MQNPIDSTSVRDLREWKEKCNVKGQPYCSLPNACPSNTRELPGETNRLHTCMECPNNYPWILDPTGDGFSFKLVHWFTKSTIHKGSYIMIIPAAFFSTSPLLPVIMYLTYG